MAAISAGPGVLARPPAWPGASGHGGLHALAEPTRWLSKQASVTQAAVLVVAIASHGTSSLIVTRVTLPVLRLLKGNLAAASPPPLVKLRRRLTKQATQADRPG